MKLNIHPDYQITMGISLEDSYELFRKFTLPEGMEYREIAIPGPEPGQTIQAFLYKPATEVSPLPIIMDVHGGGFVGGEAYLDRTRDIALACNVPALIVAINYRLAPEHPFPAALMDCLAAWNWLYENGASLGGDPERMGCYGTSAGGNLCAAMAFYIRDHGGPKIALNALNVPGLSVGTSLSKDQMRYGAPALADSKGLNQQFFMQYLGPEQMGKPYSYYAVPNLAVDFIGLPPTLIITAEYDPIREDGMEYCRKLREADVPVELYLMPRVGHGFDGMVPDAPMTKWIWKGIAMSFQREFRMPIG